MSLEKSFICKFCNKNFKTSQSRSNHYGKFHKTELSSENNPNIILRNDQNHPKIIHEVSPTDSENKILEEKYKCRFCEKSYKFVQGRWKHEKICQNENTTDKEKQLENKLAEMEKIQSQLLKSIKIHPKTLQKINNQLNNTNNGTINNITNNIIIPVTEQNLKAVLNRNEKMSVLTSGKQAHLKLTDILYKKEEYKPFRNIYITNLSNDIGYVYDDKEKRFIVKSKKDIMDDYGVERFSDIQYFYEELGPKLNDSKKLQNLKKIVNDYFNNNDFKDIKNKEMLISLYNNNLNVKKIYEQVNKEIKEIDL